MKFKKGDCLRFKVDSTAYGVGVVFDFSQEEAGIWYGLLLTDYESSGEPTIDSIIVSRFLGRKIHTSLNDEGFMIGIDTEFVLDSVLMDNFSLIGNLSLNDKVRMGTQGATSDMKNLILRLEYARKQRLAPPDDYREHLTKLNDFRPDEYFDIKDFLSGVE